MAFSTVEEKLNLLLNKGFDFIDEINSVKNYWNFTSPTDQTEWSQTRKKLYINFGAYAFIGSLMVIANLIVLLTLIVNKLLQKKEFFLLGGLAMGDFIYGFGYFCSAVARLIILDNHEETQLVTAWYCMQKFYIQFMILGESQSRLMLFLISLDRLYCVTKPIEYLSLGRRYAFGTTLLPWCYCVTVLIIGVTVSYQLPRTPSYSPICFSLWASSKAYGRYIYLHTWAFAVLSVILYLAVMMILRRRSKLWFIRNESAYASIKRPPTGASNRRHSSQTSRQVRVTKMISIIALTTVFFYIIPDLLPLSILLFDLEVEGKEYLMPICWNLMATHCILNVGIYYWKNTELRKGMLRLLVPWRKNKSIHQFSLKIRNEKNKVNHNEKCNDDLKENRRLVISNL